MLTPPAPRLRRGKTPFPGAIPIVVLTGALGAGKTTLLRRLLATPNGAHSAVIVNEFSDLGIDQQLVGQADVSLLANGCFCCRASGDLTRTLKSLFDARRSGSAPDFARVIIETSGLADPLAILMALAGDPDIARLFFVQTIAALVDASLGIPADETSDAQLALADILILTKTDLAGLDATDAVRAHLAAAWPDIPILTALSGDIDAAAILARSPLATSLPLRLRPPHHPRGISRHSITSAGAWDLDAFLITMQALAALRGPGILRIKGLIHAAGRPRPIVYNQVRHLIHIPTELEAWPGEPETQLVLITQGVEGAAIEALIEAGQNLAGR